MSKLVEVVGGPLDGLTVEMPDTETTVNMISEPEGDWRSRNPDDRMWFRTTVLPIDDLPDGTMYRARWADRDEREVG